ncbi:MAG: hypothetical protein Q8P67_23740, partial [archaeon]|nr:hypothetical protein [archaeon]
CSIIHCSGLISTSLEQFDESHILVALLKPFRSFQSVAKCRRAPPIDYKFLAPMMSDCYSF